MLEDSIEEYEMTKEDKDFIRDSLREMHEKALPYFINSYYVFSLGKHEPHCMYETYNRAFEETIYKSKQGFDDIPVWAYHIYPM